MAKLDLDLYKTSTSNIPPEMLVTRILELVKEVEVTRLERDEALAEFGLLQSEISLLHVLLASADKG